jgi:hypothetical protein
VSAIYRKLEVRNREQAREAAQQRGLALKINEPGGRTPADTL